jgi:RimJ/RimL family protein N-acetyltransferase
MAAMSAERKHSNLGAKGDQVVSSAESGVSLREFRPGDAGAVERWFNDARVTENMMEVRGSFSAQDAGGWVERAMRTDGPDRKWAVLLDELGEPAGFTALYGIGGQLAPELGCVIADPAAWGKGVGREAERLTLERAFADLGAHRVYGRIPATNEAAKRVVTWLGWSHEGTMRKHIRREDGTLIDCELWGITADEWAERWRGPS